PARPALASRSGSPPVRLEPEMSPPIRLVLADDHPIVLNGLESLFHLEPDFQVVARCVNGEETLAAVRQHRPDILILDIHMPRKDGLEVLRELDQDQLPTRVVLLAAALEEHEVLEALRLGARGMVLKELAPQLLVQCVRKVHAGGQWLEKSLSAPSLQTLVRREADPGKIGRASCRERVGIGGGAGVLQTKGAK